MLDDVLDVPSCFDLVFMAEINNSEHYFLTQTDGLSPVKSPEGMFETLKIPNDLQIIDKKIREYYEIGGK